MECGQGSINQNTFQDQVYKHGSLGNPDPAIARKPQHILDSIEIGSQLGSRDVFGYGSRWVELSGTQKYSSAAAMVRRSTPERPPTPD